MLVIGNKTIGDVKVGELFRDLLVVIHVHATSSVGDFEEQVSRAFIVGNSYSDSTFPRVSHRIIEQIHQN